MKIENVPFQTTDWSTIAATEHPGEAGVAHWRTVEQGNVRVRMVEYSPGYIADHWCGRGTGKATTCRQSSSSESTVTVDPRERLAACPAGG